MFIFQTSDFVIISVSLSVSAYLKFPRSESHAIVLFQQLPIISAVLSWLEASTFKGRGGPEALRAGGKDHRGHLGICPP